MLRVERAALRIAVGPLLRGRLVVPEIALSKPELLLERTADGHGNWTFRNAGTGAGPAPRIGTLLVDDGILRYRDQTLALDVDLSLDTLDDASLAAPRIRVKGDGTLRGERFAIQGQAGSLLALADNQRPFWLDLQARSGRTRSAFSGTLTPFSFQRIEGKLDLQGADLSNLYPLIPVPMPWTPPYQISGDLKRQGDSWSLTGLNGTVGDSDLAGSFALDVSSSRPSVSADLSSRRLDYRDLGGFVGLPPGRKPEAVGTPQQKAEAARRAAERGVLPRKSYNLERLRAVDANVTFRGRNVAAAKIPLTELAARMSLNNGELKFDPLEFGIVGGRVVWHITANAREPTLRTAARVDARNIDITRIWPELRPPKGSPGRVGGRANFSSAGDSVAEILSSMNGDLALIMTGGTASALTLFLTNLDLARAAALLLGGDDNAGILCAVAAFEARQGVLQTETLVVDTTAVKITGAGSIDFRDEVFDLRLDADSKRPSPLALRGPIVIQGSFKNPDVRPELGQVAARAAGALALGALATPLAALLPLVDPGDARDANCKALLAEHGPQAGKAG